MKYKMQNKQNQLIERISNQHLVVGVDIVQPFIRQCTEKWFEILRISEHS